MQELFRLYGIDLDGITTEWSISQPANSHVVSIERERGSCTIPVKLDPGFDLSTTSDLGRMVQEWGPVPLSLLSHLAAQPYTYAFIGHEDFTMYPILQPGSFVLVDEAKRKVTNSGSANEFERPIFFLQHRTGFACGWCSIDAGRIVLQPHPASGCEAQVFDMDEAEILGQVTGVAMRFDHPRRRRKGS